MGDYNDYNIHANSNKIFGCLDFNLDEKTSIALRHNFISSDATNLERSSGLFKFASQDYTQHDIQSPTLLEIKSKYSSKFPNILILGYTNIHDYRDLISGQANLFPALHINGAGTSPGKCLGIPTYYAGSNLVLLGSDREASIFNTRQKTIELTDNLNCYVGSHAPHAGHPQRVLPHLLRLNSADTFQRLQRRYVRPSGLHPRHAGHLLYRPQLASRWLGQLGLRYFC